MFYLNKIIEYKDAICHLPDVIADSLNAMSKMFSTQITVGQDNVRLPLEKIKKLFETYEKNFPKVPIEEIYKLPFIKIGDPDIKGKVIKMLINKGYVGQALVDSYKKLINKQEIALSDIDNLIIIRDKNMIPAGTKDYEEIEKIIKEKMELPSKIAVRISGTKLNINNLIFELSHYQENIEYITDIQIEPINDLFSIKILEYLTNYPEPNAKIIDLLKEHEVLLDKAISQSDSVLLTVLKDKFIDEKYIAIKSEAMPQYSESEIRFAIDYFRTFIVKITDEEYVKKNIYSINEHQLLKECEFLETVLGPTNKYHKIIRFIKDNCNALTGDQAVLLGKIRASIKRRGN